MPFRFVRPTARRLELENDRWLLVRDRLTAGDQREMFKRYYVSDPRCQTCGGERRRVDEFESAVATVLAYLIDWNAVDVDGVAIDIRDQPVDVVRSALDHLDPEDYTAIKIAVEEHVEAMARERAEEKKRQSGATTSSETSISPDGATGLLTRSAP